jgi:RhtB (resistance to homoserine/threonine) family protein
MENYLPEFITVATLHLLAVVSPGPDFVMISRNSLIYSRRTGVYSSIGLGLGILVHVIYSLIGIAYIISKSIVLFNTIKLIGAVYLIYIGYKSLRAKPVASENGDDIPEAKTMSAYEATRSGFLTNVLNPKATLFFLALFTQVINSQTPLFMKVAYGIEMSVVTFLWFTFVSLILSHQRIKISFSKIQHRVEQSFGLILIALGLKVALTRSK